MDAIARRIQWILDQRGLSARELARRAELSSETHVRLILERGGARTAGQTLARIARAGDVNTHWLLTGEGPRELGGAGDDHEPMHRNLPGWREARAFIQAERDIPPWIWDKAGRARGLAPMSPLTVEWVRDLVMDLWKHMPREAQVVAENAARDAGVERKRKRKRVERPAVRAARGDAAAGPRRKTRRA